MVGDYNKNYFKTAGLKAGDEIVKVNGLVYKDISREQWKGFYKKDSLEFDIMRNKKTMKLVIPIDKNEDQSD